MKNKHSDDELKLPASRQVFPESPELSMDRYYEFVFSNLTLFGRPPLERSDRFQRFVIRDEGDEYPAPKNSRSGLSFAAISAHCRLRLI